MMKLAKSLLAAGIAAASVTGFATLAKADGVATKAGDILVRARAIGVLPEDEGKSAIGGTPNPDNAFVPEVDFSYFVTDNIALELIVATTKHDLKLDNSSLGTLDLGSTWLLPPTLTAQYHFNTNTGFKPYLGAGINYTLPFNEDAAGGTVTKLEADGAFGYAFQAGVDYWINESWGINLDVKKVYVSLDAKVNNTIDAELDLDPWIAGVGVTYRF